MIRRKAPAALLFALCLSSTANAAAQESERVREIKYDVPIGIGVSSTLLALVVGAEIAKADIGPVGCRWCARDADGKDTLNPIDRGARGRLVWKTDDTPTAARISDILAIFGAPSMAFGGIIASTIHETAEFRWPIDALIVTEAVAVSLAVNQSVKLIAARQRPFAHFAKPAPDAVGGTTALGRRVDENLSFYSGHTTLTFTLAAASGTVASLRDYRLAPMLWAGGFTIAAAVGFLRISADKHYVTDVLVGALMGSAIGIAIPLIFHPRRDGSSSSASNPSSSAPPSQQVIGFGGAF
jgi:membrane-associated phospholipid phosphatase